MKKYISRRFYQFAFTYYSKKQSIQIYVRTLIFQYFHIVPKTSTNLRHFCHSHSYNIRKIFIKMLIYTVADDCAWRYYLLLLLLLFYIVAVSDISIKSNDEMVSKITHHWFENVNTCVGKNGRNHSVYQEILKRQDTTKNIIWIKMQKRTDQHKICLMVSF